MDTAKAVEDAWAGASKSQNMRQRIDSRRRPLVERLWCQRIDHKWVETALWSTDGRRRTVLLPYHACRWCGIKGAGILGRFRWITMESSPTTQQTYSPFATVAALAQTPPGRPIIRVSIRNHPALVSLTGEERERIKKFQWEWECRFSGGGWGGHIAGESRRLEMPYRPRIEQLWCRRVGHRWQETECWHTASNDRLELLLYAGCRWCGMKTEGIIGWVRWIIQGAADRHGD